MTSPTPTLIRIVSLRVLLFGLLAMLIQVIYVFASYWQDDQGLARSLVELETNQLAAGLVHGKDGSVRFILSPTLAERYKPLELQEEPATFSREDDELVDGYYARIRTRDGAVLFTNCNEDCTDHLLPLTVNPPSFWERLVRPGKPLFFAGGRTVDVGGETIHIELAVIRDPEFRVAGVLAEELKDHMVVPMTLMLTLVIGATIWSIATALRPVATAAEAAERIDPSSKAARIGTDGMPLEIARFANAVNRGSTGSANSCARRNSSPRRSPTRSGPQRPSSGWSWSASTTRPRARL